MPTVHLIDNSTKKNLLSLELEEVPRIGDNLCIYGLSDAERTKWSSDYTARLELLNSLELTVVAIRHDLVYNAAGSKLGQYINVYCNCSPRKEECGG
jgi:hypothetical protein